MNDPYTIATFLVLLPGLVGSGTYMVLHRPRRLWRTQTLNADGWVVIVFLTYLLTIAQLILRGHAAGARLADEIGVVAFRAAIDVLVTNRVLSFVRYQRAYNTTQREEMAVDDGSDS